jgi:hypothetical protein
MDQTKNGQDSGDFEETIPSDGGSSEGHPDSDRGSAKASNIGRLGHLKEGEDPPKWTHGQNLSGENVVKDLEKIRGLLETHISDRKRELHKYKAALASVKKNG